ncbi:DNA-binding MarR family transcriptional regulator [Kineosphaera limosa]|uniref:MarR family winged helix-turn-helix transcriptional regulator n=1 Tax=Kineosphaera limosa TaxID=111564 RepID=UPI0002EEDD1B|nr:MarR family winged helix-turn-helix transcriptional regulator [Kineosphaera limosa]NYD99127.1 DNA-binding MarR family transcriptional regulator [Kineosphaera limosa]
MTNTPQGSLQSSAAADATAQEGPADSADHLASVNELRSQFVLFKRTLNLLRANTAHPDLGPSGLPMLGMLHWLGPQRTTALAAKLFLDPSTVSRQVDTLTRSGYVEKLADPDDGRASLVHLTDTGEQALTQHLQTIGSTLNGLLADWSVADLRTLSALLGRLNSDVHARFPGATDISGPSV